MMVKQETCFGAAFKCKGAAESVSTPSSFKKFCIPHFCAINYTKQNLPLRPFVHPSLAQLILHKYALSKKTFARQLVILEGFIVGIKWIIIEVISWKHDYHLRLPLVWKMDPAFLQFKSRSNWRSAFGVGLSVASLPACGRLLWQPSKGQCWKLCCRPRSWDVLLHSHCPAHQVRGTTYYGGCEDAYQGTSHVLESPLTSV